MTLDSGSATMADVVLMIFSANPVAAFAGPCRRR